MRKILYCFFIITVIFQFISNAQSQRCGTHTPSQIVYDNTLYKLSSNITVAVIFHVLYKNDGTGNVPLSQLSEQIDSLNGGYLGSMFTFYLAGI